MQYLQWFQVCINTRFPFAKTAFLGYICNVIIMGGGGN